MRACAYLLQVVGCYVVYRGVDVGLLQAVETALQRAHEALPQVVHRADELVGHRLVQTHHNQLLDLVDARLDVLGGHRLSVWCHNDIWVGDNERNKYVMSKTARE